MTVSLIPRYVGVYRRYSIWSIYKVASDCNRDSFQSKRIYKAYSFVFCCLRIEMIHYGGHVFNLLSFPCILTAPFNYILLLSFVIIIWCKDLGKEARFKSITTLHRNIHFNNIQCCVFLFFFSTEYLGSQNLLRERIWQMRVYKYTLAPSPKWTWAYIQYIC